MNTIYKRIYYLEQWFKGEYIQRLEHIRRCNYLNIKPDESMYDLQKEAYEKEQEYRELTGKPPLEPIPEGIIIV